MFIVNNMGNICEKVRSVKIGLRKNESIMSKVLKKKEELEDNLSTASLLTYAQRVENGLREYVKENKYELEAAVIYVNDTEFGIYNRKAGETIFQEIVSALKRKETLFDLRKYEEMNEVNK